MKSYKFDIVTWCLMMIVSGCGVTESANSMEASSAAQTEDPWALFDGHIRLWPDGNLRYCFHHSVSLAQQDLFVRACNVWTQASRQAVRCMPATTDIKNQCVGARGDYVEVSLGDSWIIEAGGDSYVGRTGGSQELRIGVWEIGILVHEIGHAFGRPHEQSRGDQHDNICVTENVPERYNKYWDSTPTNWYTPTWIPYDPYSIMHYGNDDSSAPYYVLRKADGSCGDAPNRDPGLFAGFLNLFRPPPDDEVLSDLDGEAMRLLYYQGSERAKSMPTQVPTPAATAVATSTPTSMPTPTATLVPLNRPPTVTPASPIPTPTATLVPLIPTPGPTIESHPPQEACYWGTVTRDGAVVPNVSVTVWGREDGFSGKPTGTITDQNGQFTICAYGKDTTHNLFANGVFNEYGSCTEVMDGEGCGFLNGLSPGEYQIELTVR